MTPQERDGGAARARAEAFDGARAKPQHALDSESSHGTGLLGRLIAGLPAIIYRSKLDSHRTVEFMSLGCRTLMGFEAADLVGNRVTSFAQLIDPGDLPRVQEVVRAAARAGQPFEVTYAVTRVDGRRASLRDVGYGVRGPSGEAEAVEGIITAVTQPTDQELEHLVLEVAHDLNNALGTIKTTAELSQLEARDRAVISDLGDIVGAATRAGNLVERLRRGLTARPDATRGGK